MAKRTELATAIIMGKLDGKTVPQLLADPRIKALANAPGVFEISRRQGNVPSQTIITWLRNSVYPVAKQVSPVLHALLDTHYLTFRAKYHPLSETAENLQ